MYPQHKLRIIMNTKYLNIMNHGDFCTVIKSFFLITGVTYGRSGKKVRTNKFILHSLLLLENRMKLCKNNKQNI